MKLSLLIFIGSISTAALANDLTVEIQNRKSKSSQVLCCLFVQPDGFPMDRAKSEWSIDGELTPDGKTVCEFNDISAGEGAVSVMEDLNGNGKMDTGAMGIPKEPWGVSKNAPAQKFGPPKFSDAKIQFSGKAKIAIKLNR